MHSLLRSVSDTVINGLSKICICLLVFVSGILLAQWQFIDDAMNDSMVLLQDLIAAPEVFPLASSNSIASSCGIVQSSSLLLLLISPPYDVEVFRRPLRLLDNCFLYQTKKLQDRSSLLKILIIRCISVSADMKNCSMWFTTVAIDMVKSIFQQ